MQFRQIALALTFVVPVCTATTALGQQLPTHPIKCANPQALSNPKGKKSLQFSLLTGFRDSLLSPSGRFMIYYDGTASDTDSVTTPAYVQRAAEEADSAYAFEIGELGYTPPEFTDGAHYIIYLTPFHLDPQFEAYGATFPLDGGQLANSSSGNERWRTYLVIDNSFTSNIYATHGFDALRITIFHEFFHMTQFSGYGRPPSGIPNYVYFQEMSAVWMEWLSTPTVKDYLQYVGSYLSNLDLRLDLPVDVGEYGEYLFFAYLTHRYDTTIVKKIWIYYRDSSGDPVTCIDQVLRGYGSSFCQEYQNFGAELMQTGRRYGGESLLPDAQILPLDTIPEARLALGSTEPFITDALSLQFDAAGDGADTCIEIIARDTDRDLQSNGSIEFTALGASPILILDSASAYCDSEICIAPFASVAGLDVHPSPFLSTGSTEAYILASTNPSPPISVVMNIMDLNMNEIRSTKLPAAPFKGSWNAIWDGRDDNGNLAESGEYVYTLHVDGALKVGKIVVVRK